MAKTKMDNYVNIFDVTVTESAANTLTFEEMNVGLNVFDKVGLVISRIEINWEVASQYMVAAGDVVRFAITQSDQITGIGYGQRAVIWQWAIRSPGANVEPLQNISADFSTLPGGGLLITPRPVFVALESGSIATALTAYFRIYFTVLSLQPSEYFELLESRQYFG